MKMYWTQSDITKFGIPPKTRGHAFHLPNGENVIIFYVEDGVYHTIVLCPQ